MKRAEDIETVRAFLSSDEHWPLGSDRSVCAAFERILAPVCLDPEIAEALEELDFALRNDTQTAAIDAIDAANKLRALLALLASRTAQGAYVRSGVISGRITSAGSVTSHDYTALSTQDLVAFVESGLVEECHLSYFAEIIKRFVSLGFDAHARAGWSAEVEKAYCDVARCALAHQTAESPIHAALDIIERELRK